MKKRLAFCFYQLALFRLKCKRK